MFLPWGHYILIIVSWISFILYIAMIIIVLRGRNNPMLKSSYIKLFFIHSSGEFLLFLCVEFVMRPRRWAWNDTIFNENMKLLAQMNYAFIVIARISMSLGHVVCAFNRFSVVVFGPKDYNEMWSNMVILLVFFGCWWTGCFIVVPVANALKDDIVFKNTITGTIQLFGGRFTEFEAYFMAPFCILCTTIIFTLYTVALCKFKSSTVKLERRLIICGLISAFPFVSELVRSFLGIASFIFKNDQLFIMGGDLWFYETELSFCFQVWLHAVVLRPIRNVLLCKKDKPRKLFEKASSKGTVSIVVTPVTVR